MSPPTIPSWYFPEPPKDLLLSWGEGIPHGYGSECLFVPNHLRPCPFTFPVRSTDSSSVFRVVFISELRSYRTHMFFDSSSHNDRTVYPPSRTCPSFGLSVRPVQGPPKPTVRGYCTDTQTPEGPSMIFPVHPLTVPHLTLLVTPEIPTP